MGLRVLVSPDLGTLIPPYSYPSLLGTPLLHSSVLLLLVPPGLRILVSPDLSSFLPSYSSPRSSALLFLIPPGPPYPRTSGALYPRTPDLGILILHTPTLHSSVLPHSIILGILPLRPFENEFRASFLPPPSPKKRTWCRVARGK